MTLLQTFTKDFANRPTVVVCQSSQAQSAFPVFKQIVNSNIDKYHKKSGRVLAFHLLHAPDDLLGPDFAHPAVKVYDWNENVPGYGSSTQSHAGSDISAAVEEALTKCSGPICAVIDSMDTLVSDLGSLSEAYKWLRSTQTSLSSRAGSILVLHGTDTKFISFIVQPTFSSSLLQVKAHPVGLAKYLATEYSTPPPPYSHVAKFWSVFTPISERQHTINELVFGTKGEVLSENQEILLEVLSRRPGGQGSKKRSVERELEAWSATAGPCEWSDLDTLKELYSKSSPPEAPKEADPTQNLSFNLSMTLAQQEARASVPLPYAHEGNVIKQAPPAQGVILYDPDSADDLDDDDPDEDLDI